MKHLILLTFTLFTLSSFAHPSKSLASPLAKTKISTDLNEFLKGFENQVKLHESLGIMEFMDTEYLDLQLKDMLEGNVDQFLNEFFCGDNVKTNEFECPGYQSIKKLKRQMVVGSGSNEFEVRYIIIGKGFKVEAEWLVTSKKVGTQTIYGLLGAMG
ncbi:MAG: hypothetical protein GQ574_17420 [Crocinitomix sp.]|nr:hypothetical protein [Crocinitomix sp.]